MNERDTPADVRPSDTVGVAVSVRALEWNLEYETMWADMHHGFTIMVEPDDPKPYHAAWGEGDTEEFATLEQAMAWCQAEIDAWARRWVLVTSTAI